MRAWCCAVLLVGACGGHGVSGDDDQKGDASPPDTQVAPGWTALIERPWSIAPLTEYHKCRVIQLTADTYVTAFRLIAPSGTHHVLLTSPTTATLGDSDCEPTPDPQLLYAGGISSNDVTLPTGVAVKLTAGQYLKLTLHVFNSGDTTLSGTSGIHIMTAAADQVVNEADMVFLGNPTFQVGAGMVNVSGSCSAPASWNVVTLWPHMHGWGTHQKVTVQHGNGMVETLLDQAYDVNEQSMYAMTPTMLVHTNDTLEVTCTYLNDTGSVIYAGDSVAGEMCLTGMLKYPKGGSEYACASP